jgi:hypothetical protein
MPDICIAPRLAYQYRRTTMSRGREYPRNSHTGLQGQCLCGDRRYEAADMSGSSNPRNLLPLPMVPVVEPQDQQPSCSIYALVKNSFPFTTLPKEGFLQTKRSTWPDVPTYGYRTLTYADWW